MTGFRVLSQPIRAFKGMGAMKAKEFEPDVKKFLGRSLTTAIGLTPQRNGNTIRAAQKKQYQHRINYIPSYHTLENPSLIVNDEGEQWMFRQGKWYRPDIWNLPDDIWSDYQTLNEERERRMNTSEAQFIEARMQARFLFRKTWWEIGQSAGVQVFCPQPIINSVTRRKPPLNPPRGYAQPRGGKDVYSIVVRNPFLDQVSEGGHTTLATAQYKQFNGTDIINRAMAAHRPAFEKSVASRAKNFILKILQRFL